MLRRYFSIAIVAVVAFALVPDKAALAANEKELSADAVRITGDALLELMTDGKVEGWYLDDGDWYFYKEHYKPDGTLSGVGGPANDKDAWTWKGKWKIDDDDPDKVCFKYPSTGDSYCREVYLDEGVYKDVTAGDVHSYWEPQN